MNTNKVDNLNPYHNIEIGDEIFFPNSYLLNKGGVVTSMKGLNAHAKVVYTSNGGVFPISRYKTDYVLWCD